MIQHLGGPDPGIIKGGADDGETPLQTAIREMEEEVGISHTLITSHTEIYSDKLKGLSTTYQMHVFACKLESKPKLALDTNEISKAVWMTYDDFSANGRKSQLHIVEKCIEKIS